MKKPNIFAIAPYHELEVSLKECAAEFKDTLTVDIASGNLNSAMRYVHSFATKRYDLIISRGGTAKLLQSLTTVPVIEIETSPYDMLRAIQTAQQYQTPFAIVGYANVTSTAAMLKEILRLPCDIVEINENSQVEKTVATLLGITPNLTILGDVVTVEITRQLGGSCLLITSGKESIRKAFQDALNYHVNISHIHSEYNVFRDAFQLTGTPTVIYNSVGELYFHNLTSGDTAFFPLLDDCQKAIPRLETEDQVEIVRRSGRDIYQINGRRIRYEDESFYLFFLLHSASKVYSGKFFRFESFEAYDSDLELLHINNRHLERLRQEVLKQSARSVSYLICGEPGSGKDIAAQYLHRNGKHPHTPMLTIECKDLTPERWASFIRPANSPVNGVGNTIYFRELTQLSPAMQEVLYRYLLDTGLAKRCLLISSASAGISSLTFHGSFHHPLLMCLSDIRLNLPSLRDRPDDVPMIAALLVNQYNKEYGKNLIGFEPKAAALLRTYAWPFNLSQLRIMVRDLVVAADHAYISEAELSAAMAEQTAEQQHGIPFDLSKTLDEIELDIIHAVLSELNMNQSKTAQRLGISRSTLWHKLNRK